MKITQQSESGGFRFDLEPGLPLPLRLGILLLAAAFAALAWWLPQLGMNRNSSWWALMGFIGLALALGLGRPVYSIWPGRGARFRFYLLGIPVMGEQVPDGKIQSSEITPLPNGGATLRFLDAAGSTVLTIERFRSPESAGHIAALYQSDETRRDAGIGIIIDECLKQSRSLSPLFQAATLAIVASIAPAIAVVPAPDPDPEGGSRWLLAALGVGFTLMFAAAVRRDDGVLRHSREDGFIDLWTRQGLFRILEWRQWLDGSHEKEPLAVRPARWPWIMLAVAVLEVTAVVVALQWRDERSRGGATVIERIEEPDPDAVRKGAERLGEFLRRREASGSLAPEHDPQPSE